MKSPVVLGALAALAFGLWFLWSERVPEPELSVLLVGNSYTSSNDLPELVERIAAANGTTIEVSMYAEGGRRLEDHAADSELLQLIADKAFDVVVLQEQSELPALERTFREGSLPSAISLGEWSRAAGSRVVLFQTWAPSGGSAFSGHDSYESMQADLIAAYAEMGAASGAAVAPIGEAWREALWQVIGASMHQSDGSHPTVEGSTLTAMVLAGTILGQEIDTIPDGLVDDRARDIFLDIVAEAPTLVSIG